MLSISSIRQSNKAHKSKVYWKSSSFTHRQWQSAFIIHADFSEDQLISENLGMQFSEDLSMQFLKNLNMQFSENLDTQFSEDLDTQFSENLDMKSEDLDM